MSNESRFVLTVVTLFLLVVCEVCKGQKIDSTNYRRITIDGPNSRRISRQNSPLYIITADSKRIQLPEDGNFKDTVAITNVLTHLNPDWIHSIDVLKGKEATDIYHSLGQNGVILINLKNGYLRKFPRKIRKRFNDS